MKIKFQLLLAILLFTTIAAFTQVKKNYVKIPELIRSEHTTTTEVFIKNLLAQYEMETNTTLLPQKSHNKNSQKYFQYYKGLRVENATCYLHFKNENVDMFTGKVYKLDEINISPIFTESQVINLSKKILEVELRKDKNKKSIIDHTVFSPELVICNNSYPKVKDDFVLTYKVDVKSSVAALNYWYYINANTGQLIHKTNRIMHNDAIGKGQTYYYGEQSFKVDSIDNDVFVLKDNDRNIQTFTTSAFEPSLSEVSDNDNVWTFAEDNYKSLLDAHYCTTKFYDMMLDTFGFDGVDGNHGAMNPVLLADEQMVNAYWDGSNATFGIGDCHHSPLTTMSVVAHEFTHGVTGYTSNLIYDGESGALNEALSDIFGKGLEYYADRNRFNWELDRLIQQDEFSSLFRTMNNPKKHNNPEMYKGEFWQDNADVHYNSAILNYWFTLLVDGKSGENEIGTQYNVTKQNIKDILSVLFYCQTSLLTEDSGYNDIYNYSLMACEDLYGKNSSQYSAIQEAWKAVGLPSNNTPKLKYDLALNFDIDFTSIICASGNVVDLTFKIKNEGSETIKKGTMLSLSYSGNNDVSFELLEDISSGEEIQQTIENGYSFFQFGWQFDFINLNYNLDQNIFNNEAFYYSSVGSENIDLRLNYAIFNASVCEENEIVVNYFYENISCNALTLPDNTKIELRNSDNQLIYTIDLPTDEFLFFNEPIFGEARFPKNLINNGESIDFKLIIDGDTDPTSNEFSNTYFQKSISKSVFYNFDDQLGMKDFIYNEIEFNNQVSYQSKTYFKSEAHFDNPPCKDVKDMQSFKNIATCLNLSNFTAPLLSLDIIQFKSDVLKTESLKKNSNILKIVLTNLDGQVVLEEIINNNNEGEKFHYDYDLPKNFIGEIKLDFYEAFPATNSFDFKTGDVTLIDNFSISDLVDTKDPASVTAINVFPNPGSTDIFVNTAYNATLGIYDISGKSVLQDNNKNKHHNVNMTQLAPGTYIIRAFGENKVDVVKWVKL